MTAEELLSSQMSEEQFAIRQIIQRRKIRWLCHFTPCENLPSIEKEGLRPRNLISHDFYITDGSRYDQHRDSICLSISQPNTFLLDKKMQSGKLYLLLIAPNVLYEKECLFFPHNAATASYRNIDPHFFQGAEALENLFSDEVNYQKSNGCNYTVFRKNSHKLLDCETTSKQAEVQCLDIIEPEYIKCVIEGDISMNYTKLSKFISENNVKF